MMAMQATARERSALKNANAHSRVTGALNRAIMAGRRRRRQSNLRSALMLGMESSSGGSSGAVDESMPVTSRSVSPSTLAAAQYHHHHHSGGSSSPRRWRSEATVGYHDSSKFSGRSSVPSPHEFLPVSSHHRGAVGMEGQ